LRILSERASQLWLSFVVEYVVVVTAQRLSMVAVLCCLDVVMLLADDLHRPLRDCVNELVTVLCSSMTLALVLRCNQASGVDLAPRLSR
jgi:hypothetical protein